MQRLVIKGVLPLPEDVKDRNLCRSDRTLDCPFTCQVTLYPNIRRIDIKTTVENRCKHHRLQRPLPHRSQGPGLLVRRNLQRG